MRTQRKKRGCNSTYYRNKADAAWAKIVRLMWQGKCAVCDKPGTDCHHLISRAVKSTRHSLRNGILLCKLHHQFDHRCSAHGGPMGFAHWLQSAYPELSAWCESNKNRLRPDLTTSKDAAECLADILRMIEANELQATQAPEYQRGIYG